MSDISFEESEEWRIYVKCNLRQWCDTFNPNDYYNYHDIRHDSEAEVRNYDLHMLRHSDLVIANLNAPKSIGTAQELAIAKEYRIPVIGLNEKHNELHPWINECLDKVFDNIDDLLRYAKRYYLRWR